jgi:hypothetical protein
MKKTWTQITQAVTVAAAALAAVSVSVPAHALVYNTGDAVLVIYGNEQQGYLNLGNWDTLKTAGGSFDVADILNTAGVSGANPIEYSIAGNSGAQTPMWFGSNQAIGDWTSTQKTLMNTNAYNTANTNWRGQLTTAADPTRKIYAASDPLLAFSLYFGTTDSLGGLTSVRGSSDIDSILHLLERTGAASTLAGVTTALLNSSTKLFTIGTQIGEPAPIPVPAAAILFATGLIGLVGFARRSMGLSR